MASVSGIFLRRGLADSPQAIAQTVEDVVHGTLCGHMWLRIRCPSRELLTDRFGRDPRKRQGGLEFRIRLAFRLDEGVNLPHQGRILLFGLVPTAI